MDDDSHLIDAYLSGSDEAFEELVVRYQKQIYAFIYRMIHDMEEAKDLTQKTFINAIQGLRGFRRESSFKTWLYRIASNVSINHLRQNSRESIELDESFRGNEKSPLSTLMEEEKLDDIREGVNWLPERQRLALCLRVYDGLSCSETATVMGCSEGAVKTHYHHAVKKLKAMLKEKGYEVRP